MRRRIGIALAGSAMLVTAISISPPAAATAEPESAFCEGETLHDYLGAAEADAEAAGTSVSKEG